MIKLTLISFLVFYSLASYSQQNILDFKKRNKIIDRFWVGSVIAFQLKDHEWQKGFITRIQNDSFYIKPYVVIHGMMSIDTIQYNILGFAIADVYAMPKEGYLIDYINGRFQISMSGGHVHWYWIKSGWIFRVGAAGYAALDVANGIIQNDFSLKDSKLGIAAGVFLFGVLLKYTYKPVLRIRNKYRLEIFHLAD